MSSSRGSTNAWYTDELHTCALDWLVAMSSKHDLYNHHASMLALCYVDAYLRVCEEVVENLEWILVASVWLACKFELDGRISTTSMLKWHPRLSHVTRLSWERMNAPQRNQWKIAEARLLQLERVLLDALDWRLWNESAFVAIGQECVERFGTFDDPISGSATDMAMVVLYALRDARACNSATLARACIDAAAGILDSSTSEWIALYRRGLAVAEQCQAHATYSAAMFARLRRNNVASKSALVSVQ